MATNGENGRHGHDRLQKYVPNSPVIILIIAFHQSASYICIVKMFSAILAFAFAAFILQPYTGMTPVAKQKTCCTKSACAKHPDKSEKKDCSNTGCNMISCVLCCYFMPVSGEVYFVIPSATREKHLSFNDHRLYFISSDCWHPPKKASL